MAQTDILTIREVADYLRITEKTAYRLAAGKKLPGFKVGGSWRFRQSEIDAWIDTRAKMQAKDKK
jgi:excisionase family DNA binding protein